MNREKKLFSNTIIITIGKVSTQMITFLLLPLYTSILTTEEYGIVDLLNTLVSLLLPIITFQVEQAIFRDLIEFRCNQSHKEEIMTTGIITVCFQCIIYLLLFLSISPFIANRYKFFLASNVITNIFLSLLLQIARGLGDNKKYALASFISAIFTIVFNVLFLVVFKIGAYGMLLGTMLGQIIAIVYLVLSLNIFQYIKFGEYKFSVLKKLWKYSIPLIPNAISWWVFNASDRVIATTFLGVSQNGILSASLKFSSVYITLYNIFNLSWTESVSIASSDSDFDEYFNKMLNIMLKFFVGLAVGIISCMPFVFPIMINEKFGSGYGLIPISILASLFNVVVGLISVLYIAKKNTKAIASTSVSSAIINIVVHLLLIKFVGLYAAVISTFVAFFVMSIYRMRDIRKKYFKLKINDGLIIKTFIVLLFVIPMYYMNNLYLNILSVLIAIFFAWDLNKNSVKPILNMVKAKVKKV